MHMVGHHMRLTQLAQQQSSTEHHKTPVNTTKLQNKLTYFVRSNKTKATEITAQINIPAQSNTD